MTHDFQVGEEFNIGDDIRVVVRVRDHWIDTGYTQDAAIFGQTPEWYREHGSNFKSAEAVGDLKLETRSKDNEFPDWGPWLADNAVDKEIQSMRAVFAGYADIDPEYDEPVKVTLEWRSGYKNQYRRVKS